MKKPTPLDILKFTDAAAKGHGREVEDFLEKFGAGIINRTDPSDHTALMRAVCKEKSMIVETLLNAGADINYKNDYDSTALIYAIETKNRNMVWLLLEKGAAYNPDTEHGRDVLHIAKVHGGPEMVAALEQWAEKRRQQWLSDTDFSRGLARPLPAKHPLKIPKP